MTDRYDAFLVILERDLRADDAEATLNAIRQIKGVLEVEPHVAGNVERVIASARVKGELIQKIAEVLK